MSAVRIGCSGWNYPHWRERVYPKGLPLKRWLEHYATLFDTVEVNSTFYRLPNVTAVQGWVEQTQPDFLFAVKASRYLTHIRRLRDPAEPVARLATRAEGLGDRLGPYLLQLPPTLRAAPEALDACLACFPGGARVAVEPRHESWWTDDVRDVLQRRHAALCWADRLGRPATPLWRTADWGYLRMHEGAAAPRPSYGRAALATWLDRLGAAWPLRSAADVFVFFNNDRGGAAIHNARTLCRMAGRRGMNVVTVPA